MPAQIKPLTAQEVSLLFTEIALFYQAGIPVGEGVHILTEAAHGPDRDLLEQLSRLMDRQALPLSAAMEALGAFPAYAVGMVALGEQTGKMDEVLSSLGAYYASEESLDSNLRSALTYPLIMVGMMVVVVAIILTRVLPIFGRVFAQLGGEMAPFPRMAMEMGAFMSRHSLLFMGLLGLFVGFIALLRFGRGDHPVVAAVRRLLLGGRHTAALVDAGRFASAMSLMLQSGLAPEQALDALERLMDSPEIRAKVGRCRQALGDGVGFSEALIAAELFDQSLAMLLPLGFRTGNLDRVMRHIAHRCEQRVAGRIDRAVGIIEPSLVGLLSLVVGAILLSVMLPLLGILSSMGL